MTHRLIVHEAPEAYVESPTPVVHQLYLHDSGMIATHDVSCAVCMQHPAVIHLSTGIFAPCTQCNAEGYRTVKFPRWLIWLIRCWFRPWF